MIPLIEEFILTEPFDLIIFGGAGDLALLKLLPALKPITKDEIKDHSVRGQCINGAIAGRVVPSYLEDLDSKSSVSKGVNVKRQARSAIILLIKFTHINTQFN